MITIRRAQPSCAVFCRNFFHREERPLQDLRDELTGLDRLFQSLEAYPTPVDDRGHQRPAREANNG